MFEGSTRIQRGLANIAGIRVQPPRSLTPLSSVARAQRVSLSSVFSFASNAASFTGTMLFGFLDTEEAGALAPLTSNVPFKRAFATDLNKDELKHLLNSVMRGPDFEVAEIENVGVSDIKTWSITFDVRCRLTSSARVIVKLQKAELKTRHYMQQWGPGGTTELSKEEEGCTSKGRECLCASWPC